MGSSGVTRSWVTLGRRGRLLGSGDASSRWLNGPAPRVLALHGFGGTPREMQLVLDAAANTGLGGAAPLLPGHGTVASELAACTWHDWYHAAESTLEQLTSDGNPAIAVGFSLGSLLASHLAAFHPRRVMALGLLGNACWLARSTDLVLRGVSRFHLPDVSIPKFSSDLADDESQRDHLTYDVQPWHAALVVHQAGVRTRALLPRLRLPVFIAHGGRDRVCPPANARRVARLLPPPHPRPLLLPRSRHVITRDFDRDHLRAALAAFFSQVTAGGNTHSDGAAHPVDP